VTVPPSTYQAVQLIVWSGTGNTRHVAERMAATARTRGATARVDVTPTASASPPGEKRLLGLMAPTHGFTAPWPLLKAAWTQPDVRGVDAFVFVSRGGVRLAGMTMPGFEGTAAYLPAALLALRGARLRGCGAVDMPLNWTVMVPTQSTQNLTAIVAKGQAQTDRFIGRLLDGHTAFGGLAQLLLGILILPLSLGYTLIARLLLAKMFFADERCTSCGTCAKNCPQGAIELRGRKQLPYWTYDCQNCMRCMSHCPTDAIQGGQAWLLLYVWLLSLPTGAMAATALLELTGVSAPWVTGVTGLLTDYAWIVFSVWLSYALLWLGLFVPGLRLVLSRATLTRFYRRYRGPE